MLFTKLDFVFFFFFVLKLYSAQKNFGLFVIGLVIFFRVVSIQTYIFNAHLWIAQNDKTLNRVIVEVFHDNKKKFGFFVFPFFLRFDWPVLF